MVGSIKEKSLIKNRISEKKIEEINLFEIGTRKIYPDIKYYSHAYRQKHRRLNDFFFNITLFSLEKSIKYPLDFHSA